MSRVQAAVAAMAKSLADKPWCTGGRFTLADVATGVALRHLGLRFPKIDWRGQQANLASLADKLARRQSFIDTAPPAA